MGLQEDSANIDGKNFPSNYLYSVRTNLFHEGTADGHPTYFGSVGGFTATSLSGVVAVTDAANGVFTLAGQTYHIVGTDPTGQYLVFGNAASGGEPAFAISNSGTPSTTDVRFSSNNSSVAPPVACFVENTRILTVRGEVPVEALVIGDLVRTADGRALAVTWLGRRTFRRGSIDAASDIQPIEVARDAFGPDAPMRPLRLSPGHSVAVRILDTVLIPIARLVNGSTIRRVDVDAVTYWHVELTEHAVLFAEGLAAESYLDADNRAGFDPGAAIVPLAASPDGVPCRTAVAPIVDAGSILIAVREQLHRRAERMGWTLEQAATCPMLEVDGERIDPQVSGDTIRFLVPPAPHTIRLISGRHVPAHATADADDFRSLGIVVNAITISDGINAPRSIALDDEVLGKGFHAVEEDGFRWTDGCATIEADAWRDIAHSSFLTIRFTRVDGLIWCAPAATRRRDVA